MCSELFAAKFADGEFFGVSGSLGQLSEIATIQRAAGTHTELIEPKNDPMMGERGAEAAPDKHR
jgi:hypothetical protein